MNQARLTRTMMLTSILDSMHGFYALQLAAKLSPIFQLETVVDGLLSIVSAIKLCSDIGIGIRDRTYAWIHSKLQNTVVQCHDVANRNRRIRGVFRGGKDKELITKLSTNPEKAMNNFIVNIVTFRYFSSVAAHMLRQLSGVAHIQVDLKALVGQTQVINLVAGGVETNALPENAWAVVNHRIATDSSVDEVKERDTNTLKDTVANFNLSFTAFGNGVTGNDTSTAMHAVHRGGKGVVVSPGIMARNSGAKFLNSILQGEVASFDVTDKAKDAPQQEELEWLALRSTRWDDYEAIRTDKMAQRRNMEIVIILYGVIAAGFVLFGSLDWIAECWELKVGTF
ncbi:hypothetical protein K474DRAFT_1677999 [Panus rudis PR-1116 ss-1]|nr:hypothetical protein K474DRAFT_1677999 [Panus rudis PR-1116 ss-1]